MAYDLLETCYQTDDDLTLQLLTYELKRWSRKTCLSLAAMSNFKKFIAHPCCQTLLTDLWLGGLRIRRKAHVKVILGILAPPIILFLPFKTKEQLMLQAQTAEEFHGLLFLYNFIIDMSIQVIKILELIKILTLFHKFHVGTYIIFRYHVKIII